MLLNFKKIIIFNFINKNNIIEYYLTKNELW